MTWDSVGHVHGEVFLRASHGDIRKIAEADGNPSLSFSSQLREVDLSLHHKQADAILLGGHLSEFVCFEIGMPCLDQVKLKNLLRFEIPRRIPVLPDVMSISFRKMPDPNHNKQAIVRVFAVRRKIFDDLLLAVREADIHFDAFCHPFMAEDFESRTIFACPAIAPRLALIRDERQLAELKYFPVEFPDGAAGDACSTLAAYALSKNFRTDRPYLGELPEEFRMRRFKKRKRLAILLGILVVLQVIWLGIRVWSSKDAQIQTYLRAIQRIDTRIAEQNRKIAELETSKELARKMLEAIPDESILPVLECLTQQLPHNVWMTSFRCGNGKIAITLSATGDTSQLNTIFASLNGYPLENVRQQQGPDGTEVFYVTLNRGSIQ